MQNYGQGKGNAVKLRLKIGLITYTCFLEQRGRGNTFPGKEEVSMVLALLFNVLCRYKRLLFKNYFNPFPIKVFVSGQ